MCNNLELCTAWIVASTCSWKKSEKGFTKFLKIKIGNMYPVRQNSSEWNCVSKISTKLVPKVIYIKYKINKFILSAIDRHCYSRNKLSNIVKSWVLPKVMKKEKWFLLYKASVFRKITASNHCASNIEWDFLKFPMDASLLSVFYILMTWVITILACNPATQLLWYFTFSRECVIHLNTKWTRCFRKTASP